MSPAKTVHYTSKGAGCTYKRRRVCLLSCFLLSFSTLFLAMNPLWLHFVRCVPQVCREHWGADEVAASGTATFSTGKDSYMRFFPVITLGTPATWIPAFPAEARASRNPSGVEGLLHKLDELSSFPESHHGGGEPDSSELHGWA